MLKKKIEDRIKRYKKLGYYVDPCCGNEIRNQELEWVLSELEKMTCDNCKYKKTCYKWVIKNPKDMNYNFWTVNFCSQWRAK